MITSTITTSTTTLSSLSISANRSVNSGQDGVLRGNGITDFDAVFLFIVLISSLIANGFLVCKIMTDRRLQTSINFLLMIHNILNISLCFTTLLPAAVMLTASIKTIDPDLCKINASTYLLFNYFSITNLTSIAIDRWRTISNSKYTLVAQQVIIAQVIHITTATVFALPWSYWLNKDMSVVEFSQGFLKCRMVHKSWIENTAFLVFFMVIRSLVFLVIPAVIISFCFIKIFYKVKGRCHAVGPVIQAPDGIPVGCYLKSTYTNALLVSGFILLRFPELIYVTLDSSGRGNTKEDIYAQRVIAYIAWIETAIFPFVCIMRNTTLLRKVTSTACCNFMMQLLLRKKDRRKRQYEVEQSTASDRCMITPTQDSHDRRVSVPSSSISTLRSGSPLWSRASTASRDAWTIQSQKPITAF